MMTENIQSNDRDVLMGRGNYVNQHPGNNYFRQIVARSANAYDLSSSKKTKDAIARSIVEKISERGGRFLRAGMSMNRHQEASANWTIASGREVTAKVKQAMRDVTKQDRKKTSLLQQDERGNCHARPQQRMINVPQLHQGNTPPILRFRWNKEQASNAFAQGYQQNLMTPLDSATTSTIEAMIHHEDLEPSQSYTAGNTTQLTTGYSYPGGGFAHQYPDDDSYLNLPPGQEDVVGPIAASNGLHQMVPQGADHWPQHRFQQQQDLLSALPQPIDARGYRREFEPSCFAHGISANLPPFDRTAPTQQHEANSRKRPWSKGCQVADKRRVFRRHREDERERGQGQSS